MGPGIDNQSAGFRMAPRASPKAHSSIGSESRLVRAEAHVRVRYEETDQTGVVYHANYFRYFEVGRVELLRVRGVRYRDLETSGFRLPVVEARASYRSPARF